MQALTPTYGVTYIKSSRVLATNLLPMRAEVYTFC